MIQTLKQLIYFVYFLKLCFILASFNLSAQTSSADPTPKEIPVKKLQKDLIFLKKALEDIHPGMYHFIDRENYNQLYDSIYQSIQEPLSRTAFREKIVPLILQIQCGHTRLLTSNRSKGKAKKKQPKKYLPLQLKQVEGKVLVNKNFSEDTTVLHRGVEIVAINQMPIDSILHVFYRNTTRGSDGDNQTGKQFYNLRYFVSRFAEWFGRPDSFQIDYLQPKSTAIQSTSIAALGGVAMSKNYKTHYGKPPKNITVKWIDEETAVLKIRSFVDFGSHYGLNFWGHIRAAFSEVKRLGAKNLVIDIRGNGGGTLKNSLKLMQYVVEEPFSANKVLLAKAMAVYRAGFREKMMMNFTFRRTDSTYISSKNFTGIRKPKRNLGFKGKIYLLIDGGSYSASALFAAHLHSKNRAVIVGEETGGNYYLAFAGFWTTKTLPYSKVSVRIPLIRLEYNVDSEVAFNKGVPPDVEISQSYGDFLEGKDTQLEEVLKMIEGSRR